MGSSQSSDQSVAKAIPQIPWGNSLRRYLQEPVVNLLYFSFCGRASRNIGVYFTEFLLINLKLMQKTKNVWVYKSRQTFYSRSPVESWPINELGLLNI